MNWVNFSVRGILTVVLVCGLLFLADLAFPMGALVVFLLVSSILFTWATINILKDDDVLTSFFGD